ncbi:alpha/beta fold hydrolase [Litchfieldia alkalitelluris]|uniref:alpha/beta fold hydrolase n=1 Tax=Litchfieldia alkalitelluris TaxID=304268 RepID=UPI000998E733|nr:alpha/beta hydrolase [Litchfieldia alkalitelluris]
MNEHLIQKKHIKIGEINVFCEYLLNEKPPIVLIHGFVSSTFTFNRLIPLLAKHFSVLAIDLPGFGQSEKSKKFIYSFDQYSNIIVECIKHFNLRKVLLVGHSMGGQVALYTARKAPNNISRIILLCSSGYLKRASKWLILLSHIPYFSLFIKYYIKYKGVQNSLRNVFYHQHYITEEVINEFGKPLKEVDFYHALCRFIRHREGDLTKEQLKEISVPTLLLWGENDKVVPLKTGQQLVQDLPIANLITYNKTGHLLTFERTREVFEQILAFSSDGRLSPD